MCASTALQGEPVDKNVALPQVPFAFSLTVFVFPFVFPRFALGVLIAGAGCAPELSVSGVGSFLCRLLTLGGILLST